VFVKGGRVRGGRDGGPLSPLGADALGSLAKERWGITPPCIVVRGDVLGGVCSLTK